MFLAERQYIFALLAILFAVTTACSQVDSVHFKRWASTSVSVGVSGTLGLTRNHLTFTPLPRSFFYRNNDMIKTVTIPVSEISCIRKHVVLPIQQTGFLIYLKDERVFDFYMFGGRSRLIRLVRERLNEIYNETAIQVREPLSFAFEGQPLTTPSIDSSVFKKKVNLLLHNLNYVAVPTRGKIYLSTRCLVFQPDRAAKGSSQNDWVVNVIMPIKDIKGIRRNWAVLLPFRLRVKMKNGRVYRFAMYGQRKKLINLVRAAQGDQN